MGQDGGGHRAHGAVSPREYKRAPISPSTIDGTKAVRRGYRLRVRRWL
jgi:hypothetical protein